MLERFKQTTAQDWLLVAAWTVLGTLLCVLAAYLYVQGAFADFGPRARHQANLSAVIVPLLIAPPLFLLMPLDIVVLRVANRRLDRDASTDSLTRVLNRGAFARTIERALLFEGTPAGSRRGALLVIDADNFKSINDRYGHHHGDEALTIIARSIRAILRGGDVVGRLGGEEFGVFLPGVDIPTARTLAERIRKAINLAVFAPAGQMSPLSVSVGGAVFENRIEFIDLFRQADLSLYRAKECGRNRVEVAAAGREHKDAA